MKIMTLFLGLIFSASSFALTCEITGMIAVYSDNSELRIDDDEHYEIEIKSWQDCYRLAVKKAIRDYKVPKLYPEGVSKRANSDIYRIGWDRGRAFYKWEYHDGSWLGAFSDKNFKNSKGEVDAYTPKCKRSPKKGSAIYYRDC